MLNIFYQNYQNLYLSTVINLVSCKNKIIVNSLTIFKKYHKTCIIKLVSAALTSISSTFVCRETIFGHFVLLILLLASFGFCVFQCRHIVRKSSLHKNSIRTSRGPMPRYCSKHLFRLLYYIM